MNLKEIWTSSEIVRSVRAYELVSFNILHYNQQSHELQSRIGIAFKNYAILVIRVLQPHTSHAHNHTHNKIWIKHITLSSKGINDYIVKSRQYEQG